MPDQQSFVDAPLQTQQAGQFTDAILEQAPHSSPSSSGALWLEGASKAIPAAEQIVKAGLAAPNAPRVIQRAIGASVRGAATAAGAAVGGVPGAVAGAAMSEGLTPTQATVRGWLGRTAAQAAEKTAPTAEDAVVNYLKAMGANPENLSGAALEYAKKAGRAILYDSSGRASLVPAHAAAETAAQTAPIAAPAASSLLDKAAHGLSVLSAVQGGLDLAQIADPKREDIGFLGIGHSSNGGAELRQPQAQLKAVQFLITEKGLSPSEAVKQVTGGVPQLIGPLMGLYMQSKLK